MCHRLIHLRGQRRRMQHCEAIIFQLKKTLVIATMIILVIILRTSPLTCGLGAYPQRFLCAHMPITCPILS